MSSSGDSSSEEERRKRKERRRRKERERKERKEKKRKRSQSRRPSDESEDDRRKSRRTRSRSVQSRGKEVAPSPSQSPSPSHNSPSRNSEEDWVVKDAPNAPILTALDAHPRYSEPLDDYSDEEVGPEPAFKVNMNKRIDERQYGGALLRGEGSAMAAFLQDGTDLRIPRRGEIGLTSDQIAAYETVGYVMSGSRHRRMNAVRMRKENQVISAEEKRGILKLQKEERERRETILREEFSELVSERLKTDPQSNP